MPSLSKLTAAMLPLSAYATNTGTNWLPKDTDIIFPLEKNINVPELFTMLPCGEFFLEEATIDQMQEGLSNGTLTSVQLSNCYMLRIHQTQNYINSVMQINPDAINIAAQMDAERREGKVRGPLHGIPFLVKETMATKDLMETTAGSNALLGSIVPRDAFTVKKLREAGAVLLGKATLSEWADMRSSKYSEGYSARGGQARSPYNLAANPGGSSTGSATSVSANVIPFSLGTETDGSITGPATRNAVVGFKPTVGRTSRAGVIPESENYDSVGTFGRTVKDAVYAFDAIWGIDARDQYTWGQANRIPENGYIPFISDKTALKGATFGLPWKTFWKCLPDDQLGPLLELVKLIEDAGATIINGTEILNGDEFISKGRWDWDCGTKRGYPNRSEFTVIKVDFYNNIKSYLSELTNTKMRSLEDIIEYNNKNPGTEGGIPGTHPAFSSGQDSFIASAESKGEHNEEYQDALFYTQTISRYGIDHALKLMGNELNGLLVPSHLGLAAQVAAQAGYPMVTLPLGIEEKSHIPFSFALIQSAWREDELVKYASAIEDLQLTTPGWEHKRTRPTWRNHLARNIPVC
ncbi:putative amidase [Ceratocystis fimbriata CBS 114723]|uniref:Putative amidase n=1 Tax=Ceratocystis fimbriata CBS 114723 TaxID=1035309 RepID=A0A2C5X8C9_9PEZI|nr:putative amidase [Ceratocystis fimbriata CBS 114723]